VGLSDLMNLQCCRPLIGRKKGRNYVAGAGSCTIQLWCWPCDCALWL